MDSSASELKNLASINRVAFLIDGFNLYHSLKIASRDLGFGGAGSRWLDIRSLCGSYLHLVGDNAQIEAICYFTALATHLQATNPGIIKRHKDYIDCLSETGIIPIISHFKRKEIVCDGCGKTIQRHEEKETDVAISLRLLELFINDACDTVVLVTGDTDLAPAARVSKKLIPKKRIMFAFPYQRYNQELANWVGNGNYLKISREHYLRHQFSDPFVLKSGRIINKPIKW